MTKNNLRLLPVLLGVSLLAFTLRVGEVVTGFRNLSGAANAEEQAKTEHAAPDEHATASVADESKGSEKVDSKKMPDDHSDPSDNQSDQKTKKSDEIVTGDEGSEKDSDWPDPADMDPDLANVRNDLLKDLAARRKKLDTQEKLLATREAVLRAAESEIEQKYRELSELRKQLQGLLDQQSESEMAQMKSLVRIYEGMKPADAARIFNTLDLTVLVDVLTQMSERKSSPILAAMEADRARTVTLMMAQQKKLPDLPQLVEPQAGGDDLPITTEGAAAGSSDTSDPVNNTDTWSQ